MRFLRDESGASAVEYSLIAAFMAVVLVAAVPTLSASVGNVFTWLAGTVPAAP